MPYIRTMRDYDGEPTTFKVKTVPLSAANFDAEVAKNVALGVAIVGITRGHLQRIVYSNEISSPSVPDDPLSQRENKWLIRFHDTVTEEAQSPIELGTADLTVLDPNNRGYAEMGDAGAVDAFVTAFEDMVVSADGNPVEIDSIQFVGRNS